MFSKIVLCVLLLSFVYTYSLKSIKDNTDINFPKLPENVNFELNGKETVKPKLNALNVLGAKFAIRMIFGNEFITEVNKIEVFDAEKQKECFTLDALTKLQQSKTAEEQQTVYINDVAPRFKNDFSAEKMKELEGFVSTQQKQRMTTKTWKEYLAGLIKYIGMES